MSEKTTTFPVFFLVPGLISLLLALWAGLERLPLAWAGSGGLSLLHGPLMVGGFLGTLIAAERASALGKPWPWAGPGCTGLGALVMLLALGIKPAGPGLPLRAGALLLTAGGLIYTLATFAVYRRQRQIFNLLLGLGAFLFFLADLLLMTGTMVPAVVPLWAAFLVLTIAGERLELNRLLSPRPRDLVPFFVSLGLMALGLVLWVALGPRAGQRLWGVGLVVMAAWFLWRDIARRTIKLPGVTRFVALCLLSGYGWLLVSGTLSLIYPGQTAGPLYDATWHALFVGFIMSMIFGHAPIIVPAMTGILVDFRGVFYTPLVLLHLSLAARVVGDLAPSMGLRRWGGGINALVILLFVGVLVSRLKKYPQQ